MSSLLVNSPQSDSKRFAVLVKPLGLVFMADPNLPLLQSAEQAGIDGLTLDSSCRNGTCRTCICGLTSGRVAYRIEWPGLSLDEKRQGYILPCVAYPESDLVIDLPV